MEISVNADMKFGDKLSMLIDLRSTNQSRLARQIGIAQTTISAMTAGRQRPYMDQALALARALGVTLDYLADDAIDEPTTDGLTDSERRLLWLAELVGMETALRRVAKGDESDVVEATHAMPVMSQETVRHMGGHQEGRPTISRSGGGVMTSQNRGEPEVTKHEPPRIVALQDTTEALRRELREKERPKRVGSKTGKGKPKPEPGGGKK